MITVRNRLIPFKGYCAIAIWPFIFVREGEVVTEAVMNHERIHGRQQVEMLLVGFYLWYLIEWVVRGFTYERISFEREATENESDLDYLSKRKHYAWVKYL